MKRDVSKLLVLLSFLLILATMLFGNTSVSTFTELISGCIYYIIMVAFVFSANKTVARVGYALSGFMGVALLSVALGTKTALEDINGIFNLIIAILLIIAACFYLVKSGIEYYGYVKAENRRACEETDIANQLLAYKKLLDEKIITEEEFSSLKCDLLGGNSKKTNNFYEIKKWKKLLDANLITPEEYDSQKEKLLKK